MSRESAPGTSNQEYQESILGNSRDFMAGLEARMANADPREIGRLLLDLERYSQNPDRRIEIYTDPQLDTFCCGQVPSQTVNSEGKIVEDPIKKTYLIGIPFIFAAGQAPLGFLQGEVLHEKGHALFTDWNRRKRFETLSRRQGYDPEELLLLDNCVEDPRMERVVGGPLHENERRLMFEKNRQHIIPNIAEGLTPAEGKGVPMSPPDQFKFLLKLEGLWAIYGQELAEEVKPWNLGDLNPLVREEFERIEPAFRRIVGDAKTPALKVAAEVEKLLVEQIWPAYQRIIDAYPEQDKDNEGGGGGSGQGKGGKGKSSKGKRGQKTQNGPQQEDPPEIDPNDPDSWPEPLKSIFKRMKEKHEQRLKQEAEKAEKEAEERKSESGKLKDKEQEMAKARDGFEDPAIREAYNEIVAEVRPYISQFKRILDRYLPKTVEDDFNWERRGSRFDVRRVIRSFGTGQEKPLGRRNIPEQNALILQLLIDASGSMYSGGRIENAVKFATALGEATIDRDVALEILINDDKNLTEDQNYIIKAFNEKYSSQAKARLVWVLNRSGGDNEDAEAIRVAIPRLEAKAQQSKKDYDRLGTLSIFVSDSTTQSEDTRQAAEEARAQTPFEGTAITPEPDIVEKVKYHFGPDSIVPKSMEESLSAFQQILERHMVRLKAKK